MSRCSRSRPVGCCSRARRLRTSNAAPIKRTTDNATWPAMSSLAAGMRRPVVAAKPPPTACACARIVVARSTRDARRAGASPKSATAASESNSVNASTGRSRGMRPPSAARATRSRLPQLATSSPPAAPTRASTRLSVNNCLTSRPRPAPSASRTPISRPRAMARARRRLATFAQTISSNSETPAIRINRGA